MDASDAVVRLARALADPTRIRIAALLVDRELALEQIASELGVRPRDVARHVALLTESSLVAESSTEGTARYRLDLDELRRISREAFATRRAESPIISGDEWEQKVVRDFVKDGRLTSIPVSYKKKLVILRWLVTRIPTESRLPEREINLVLQQFHPDFATLRRELVDSQLLRREHGIYWRVDGAEG